VASSFIDSLSRIPHRGFDIHLLISSEVDANLKALNSEISSFSSCTIKDFDGFSAIWRGLDSYFKGAGIVFTVFGPAYFLRARTRHVFGFAQPLIIYPKNPSSLRMPFWPRTKVRCKYLLQQLFFARADHLIVELEHVERALHQLPLFRRMPIDVVYSSVHTIFHHQAYWGGLDLPQSNADLKLGIISRNYPHKNLSILPLVKANLKQARGLNVDFYVTFSDTEWRECPSDFKSCIINVGGLRLDQCPSFYSAMDGVIFPSLLECFSAVPIESMTLKRPLFASDLPFIRDVCADFCNYFDPLDASSIAESIVGFFQKPVVQQQQHLEAAYQHVQRFPDATARAQSYLDVIAKVLS